MNTLLHQRFGLYLYEYLLIIEPTNAVKKQMQAFKRYFLKHHAYPNAIVSQSHITLMSFVQYESYEKHVIRELQRLGTTTNPFDIELHGFGSFGHTLFVDIKSANPLLALVAQRRRELKPFIGGVKGRPPYLVTKPHLTIARGLTPRQNELIWPLWKRTEYTGKFTAKNMILLKRRIGTHQYSVAQKFDFLGMLPPFSQGRLFA